MVYVDLDGVLADFNIYASDYLDDGGFMELFLRRYEDCFLTLPEIPEGMTLYKHLKDPVILTALPNRDEFIEYGECQGYQHNAVVRIYNVLANNKVQWVRNHLGDVPMIIVHSRVDKINYAKGNVLFDDYKPNIEDWERHGGVGILFQP